MASTLIKQIVSFYLYGSITPPEDITNDSLIRSDSETTSVTLDAEAYMTSNAGRFAKPSQFEVVKEFFSVNTTLVAKSYTLSEILAELSLAPTATRANIDQKEYSGGTDYLERVFLFNNTSFAIEDSADLLFVVDPDGTRHIENLRIVPQTDNFDFTGGDGITNSLNDAILPFIDPSDANNNFGSNLGLGRQVIMNFNDTAPVIENYTRDNFINDFNFIDGQQDPAAQAPLLLGIPLRNMLNDLWDEGITQFLDDQNRPILYGTNGIDVLSASQIDSIYDTGSLITDIGTAFIDDLKEFQDNGVHLIGGTGNDTISGGARNDFLDGGGDDDFLFGGGGRDELHGGSENDLLSGQTGNDRLFGDDGDDTLRGGQGNDVLDGGAGSDWADYSDAPNGASIALAAAGSDTVVANDGFGTSDTLRNIENLRGSNQTDTLTGNDEDNKLEGGKGTDTLTGGLGRDAFVFSTGDGDDVVKDYIASPNRTGCNSKPLRVRKSFRPHAF